MSIKGQSFFGFFPLIERLSADTICTHLRFTTLVILSDAQSLHLAMYTYQRVIVGIKSSLSKAVVSWVQVIFIQAFLVFQEIHGRHCFFFHVDCAKGLIFSSVATLQAGDPWAGSFCAGGQQRCCPSTWACFVRLVKQKVPGMYLAFDKILKTRALSLPVLILEYKITGSSNNSRLATKDRFDHYEMPGK